MTVTVTARDLRVLAWVGEQYTAKVDTLGGLLAACPGDVPIGLSGVRRVVGRWRQAGLAGQFSAFGWTWVALTGRGQAAVGRPGRPWVPRAWLLPHLHAVGLVRLALAAQAPALAWTGERDLRRLYHGSAHWPDGELADPDGRHVAVEVELTEKATARFDRIVDDAAHVAGRAGVWYFAPDRLAELLTRRLEALVVPTGFGVRVSRLPAVPGCSYLPAVLEVR